MPRWIGAAAESRCVPVSAGMCGSCTRPTRRTGQSGAGTRAELHDHLRRQLDNIVAQGISLSDTAIITITNAEAEAVLRQLRRWRIAAQELVEYRCADTDSGVEVGTVYRAKGLDFRAVIHPFVESAPPGTDAERERQDLILRQQFVAVTRARDYVWLGIVRG
ncbi:DEAD/DEAH box helicase [Nocardia fluminea]|uniref:hypothetical protein n=1 Tax=Nocardia fluminea TaxID=134984 RepID=UPI000C705970|nr:hypothetical protein [Nocardia fluminea]